MENKAKKYGMRYPSIDDLLTISNSKYKLAIAASKRAKELQEDEPELIETECYKTVGKALEEILSKEVKIIEN